MSYETDPVKVEMMTQEMNQLIWAGRPAQSVQDMPSFSQDMPVGSMARMHHMVVFRKSETEFEFSPAQ